MSSNTGDSKFYDKVAKKFGGFSSGVEIEKEYSNGNPEAVFKTKLLELKDPAAKVLDAGCADGRFTISISPYFGQITALDLSETMLQSARNKARAQNISNINFESQDASKISFPNNHFDIVFSRRGPTFYNEFYRVAKPDGYYLEIQIGEKDAQEIKQVFGRGQDYDFFNRSKLKFNLAELNQAGFTPIFSQEYTYTEYYRSLSDLERFLESVPIFEDFDPVKDNLALKSYAASHTTQKGIALPRHRVVVVAKKD